MPRAKGTYWVMPPFLNDAVDAASQATLKSPTYDLPPGYRYAIIAAMGLDGTAQKLGHRCATSLEILSIRYVIPLWEHARPLDRFPHHLLDMAGQVLRGELDVDIVLLDIGNYVTYTDNLDLDIDKQIINMVGRGAIAALAMAISYSDVPTTVIDYEVTDADLDPYQHDTAFHAAVAYTNGVPWDHTSDPLRRKEFWEWWLFQAVPQAWEMGNSYNTK